MATELEKLIQDSLAEADKSSTAATETVSSADTVNLSSEEKASAPKAPRKKKELKPAAPIPANLITVFQYINNNKDKITNASVISLNIANVKADRYLLVRTNHDSADIYKYDDSDKLFVINNPCDSIVAVNSGIVIKSSSLVMYVSKNCTYACEMNGDAITKIITYKRMSSRGEVGVETAETPATKPELDNVKLNVKSTVPLVYDSIKDMTATADILKKVAEFKANVVDLNYLIKIDEMILNNF